MFSSQPDRDVPTPLQVNAYAMIMPHEQPAGAARQGSIKPPQPQTLLGIREASLHGEGDASASFRVLPQRHAKALRCRGFGGPGDDGLSGEAARSIGAEVRS